MLRTSIEAHRNTRCLHTRRGAAGAVRRRGRCVGSQIPHAPLEALLLLQAARTRRQGSGPRQRPSAGARRTFHVSWSSAQLPELPRRLKSRFLLPPHLNTSSRLRRGGVASEACAQAHVVQRGGATRLHVLDGFWKMASGSDLCCAYSTGSSASLRVRHPRVRDTGWWKQAARGTRTRAPTQALPCAAARPPHRCVRARTHRQHSVNACSPRITAHLSEPLL